MKRQAYTFPKSRVSFGKLASFFGIPSERRWIRWGLWCAVLVSGAPAAHHSFALDSSTRAARAGYVILQRVTVARCWLRRELAALAKKRYADLGFLPMNEPA